MGYQQHIKAVIAAKNLLGLIVVVLAASCAPAAAPTPTIAPSPTPVTSNADWTPVTETFAGVEMVLVPAGCFTMGHDEGRRDERPEHQICFDAPFWIDKTEVTNAAYGSPGNFEGDNRPRENLTWAEARDFCAARGAEDTVPHRLPTEAEWEYAARGPDSLLYPWGNELDTEALIFDQNFNNETHNVGSRPNGASWVGALDMAGSVNEWTSSLYRPYPYDAADGREDLNDTTTPRVARSSWNSYIDFGASLPVRIRTAPETRDWFLGFRCMRPAS
jgi:formylglycine-generating enzyme required for sulfatase activity